MADWALDASAVLAFFRNEPGGELVERVFAASQITAINFSEVIGRLVDFGLDPADAAAAARACGYAVVPFDEELGVRAGQLRGATRHLGLSLGDRACLALAGREGLPVLTADRVWASLDIGVEIRLIR
jgi:PIN domain nuclease of toxin-antitoxin system